MPGPGNFLFYRMDIIEFVEYFSTIYVQSTWNILNLQPVGLL